MHNHAVRILEPACRLKPKALVTFMIVANSGLPSADSERYKPSRLRPVSFASCAMPRARAITPRACWTGAGPPSCKQASKYCSMSSCVCKYSAASKGLIPKDSRTELRVIFWIPRVKVAKTRLVAKDSSFAMRYRANILETSNTREFDGLKFEK
jgi:hypothetical protein